MNWIESIITYCFPKIILDGKPWRMMWEEKEHAFFVRVCRIFFPTAALGYIGHFFFYDLPMGLEPIDRWFAYRAIVAGASLLTAIFYFTPLAQSRLAKLPAIATTWLFCITQAMITTWWDGTPWLFSFVFVSGTLMVVRASPLSTVVLAIIYMVTQTPYLLAAGVPLSSLVSTGFVTVLLLLILKASHVADIRNFVLNQENIAAQRRIIELNIEFSDRLKAFIPRIVSDRIEALVSKQRLSVVQASVDVLKPRKAKVACLFSDIRGFTKGSRELDSFVDKSVIPDMKACSNIVEEYGGVPRKIGDLIFAYFDHELVTHNVIRCLLAGIDISRVNHALNARGYNSAIRRYILISTGEAVVGNLGGLDSSIEITALGPPVNYLSRLDELTKSPYLKDRLAPGDILICFATRETLLAAGISLPLETINLAEHDLRVRDFPEVTDVFRLKDPARSYEILQAWYRNTERNDATRSSAPSERLLLAG